MLQIETLRSAIKISKVIRKTKTSSVLKVRVAVERKLYYCYRFISEFSGKSIDHDDVKALDISFIKKVLYRQGSLEGISKRIKETKVQIDNILKLLNDAAEYRSSEIKHKTAVDHDDRNYSVFVRCIVQY